MSLERPKLCIFLENSQSNLVQNTIQTCFFWYGIFMKPFTCHTLSNGVRLVCIHAPQAPVLYISWGVSAGSAQDNIFGMAHLCEHLMFTGTKKFPQYDEELLAIGASNNAWTDQDRTIYEIESEPQHLEKIICIEADRWKNLPNELKTKFFHREKKVVINELKEGLDLDPMEKWDMQNPSDVFGINHPYGHPIIGTEESVRSIRLKDVQDFYQQCYQPRYTTICVAGNINVEQTIEIVKKYWSEKHNNSIELTSIPRPHKPQQENVHIAIPNNPPMLCWQWIIDVQSTVVAEVWSRLLSSEQYGDLYKMLVLEQYWAIDLEVQVDEHPDLSIVELRVTLASEEHRPHVQQHLKKYLEHKVHHPFEEHLIQKIKKTLRLLWYLECEELESFKEQLMCRIMHNACSLEENISSFQRVSPQDVEEFVQKLYTTPYIESHCYANA